MKIPTKYVTIGDSTFQVPDLGKMFGNGVIAILVIIAVLWLMSGIYIVGPDEAGVVRTFGQFTRIHSSGLNYHIPWPIEAVDKPKVTEIKRIEIGFRTRDRSGRTIDQPEESLMLTGSLNIIDIDLIVQYRINDPVKYLFVVRDVPMTISVATEAVIRQIVGIHTIDEALTTGKGMIQSEAMIMLQEILDSYECGVTVVQFQLKDVLPPEAVADAFREVASAKEDQERLINEAQGYANNLIPRARGEARQVVLEAQAYAAERVTRAQGDSANFMSVLAEYRHSPNVTRQRMLLETMEEILPHMEKYIIEADGDILNVLGGALPGVNQPVEQPGSTGGRGGGSR